MSGRKVGTFLKSHTINTVVYTVGTRLMMTTAKFEELKAKKIVEEYIGPWPPKNKSKINLKDLK